MVKQESLFPMTFIPEEVRFETNGLPAPGVQENLIEFGLRVCTTCQKVKSIKHFYPSKNGRNGWDNICKVCRKHKREQRDRDTMYRANRKANRRIVKDYVLAYMGNRGCEYCGMKVNGGLEFHHVDPTAKEENVAILISHVAALKSPLIPSERLSTLLAEADKCAVLCTFHHRMIEIGAWQGEWGKLAFGWALISSSVKDPSLMIPCKD